MAFGQGSYDGAAGVDTFFADWSAAGWPIAWNNLDLAAGADDVNGSSVANVERRLLRTGSADDNLRNAVAVGNDTFETGDGNDTVHAGDGDDPSTPRPATTRSVCVRPPDTVTRCTGAAAPMRWPFRSPLYTPARWIQGLTGCLPWTSH